MRSAIFDFNGTLFADSDKHKRAWHIFVKRYGKTVTEQELVERFLGRSNQYILHYLFGNEIPDAEVARMTLEKEGIYRELCIADSAGCRLSPGAESFFEYLAGRGVRFTIATGSEISNVEFYFRQFGLDRWFDPNLVVLDDGTFPGKPAPDGFLRAAKLLGAEPADCVVFEDSASGVRAAHAAGIGKIALITATWSPEVLREALRVLPPVQSTTVDFADMIRIWEEKLCL